MDFKTTFKSVAAAFLGVQSDKNRKRDFSEGKFSHFVVAGVIAMLVFIGLLVIAVNLVLP